ncbi:MAG: phosphate ABC transporter permease subunit PstC [Alphaproteobacteria bacterium]|nr:phosphate ABC transporter permease subunit PstC [Alphaproteobacteria bacterium]TAD88198.1 MAG: phosphate ABC transporter permease subunit PstC [Alphaproteobacteria bacterium]
MSLLLLTLILIAMTVAAYALGRSRAMALGGIGELHSLPSYYGYYAALWCGIPAVMLLLAWLTLQPNIIMALVVGNLPPDVQALPTAELDLVLTEVRNIAFRGMSPRDANPGVIAAAGQLASLQSLANIAMAVVALVVAILGLAYARSRISPTMRARNSVERTVEWILIGCSTIAVLTTAGIVLSLLFEAANFFLRVSPIEFLFGLKWSPQDAIRPDQVGGSSAFGAVPLFTGTLLITLIAMAVAVPVGLLSAVYLADYAPKRVRDVAKPALEVIAGIPTVVFGFFAALTVAPFIRDLGPLVGIEIGAQSALAAGMVMGVMIIPFVSSLADDVINAVPQSLRDGSAGLGATKSETIRLVVLPAALPGIVAAVMLAISKAIGETMIVVMAAGLAANLTLNPFENVTTVTVQIATLLVGDQEFDSPKTLSAFALGLVLFFVTLCLNVIALRVVNKYRERYD